MKKRFRIAIAVPLCGMSLAAQAAVTASLDRDQVGLGESVQLTLQAEGHGDESPDLSPLNQDFDVLGSSTGSNIQIVNGRMSEQRELRLSLAPKHAGNIEIPPLSWGTEKTSAVPLTVTDAATDRPAADATPASAHVFVTATLDQKQPYVQADTVLTVEVHTDRVLEQASLDFSGNSDVSVQQIGKDRQTSETRNGRRFDVIERKYLLLPQRSGTIDLAGPTLDAQVAAPDDRNPFDSDSSFGRAFAGMPIAGMMTPMRPLRLHGDDIHLNVRPRPVNASGQEWLPAKQVTLEGTWRPDGASIQAGEPLTLHLHLSAEGLTAAQLPDLSTRLALPDGIKAYPDQAKLETSPQSGGIVGSRDQDIALIASRSGHYRIPALRLSWWDTAQDAPRELVLPERTVDVIAAAGASGGTGSTIAPLANPIAPSPPLDAGGPVIPTKGEEHSPARSPWAWVSLALGLLWIGTLAIGWRRRRRVVAISPAHSTPAAGTAAGSDASRAGEAYQAFRHACRANDPHAARRNLLRWARCTWGEGAPAGLNALAARLDDPRLGVLLQALDRACYSGGDWNGEALAQTLTVLPAQATRTEKKQLLADLYGPQAR